MGKGSKRSQWPSAKASSRRHARPEENGQPEAMRRSHRGDKRHASRTQQPTVLARLVPWVAAAICLLLCIGWATAAAANAANRTAHYGESAKAAQAEGQVATDASPSDSASADAKASDSASGADSSDSSASSAGASSGDASSAAAAIDWQGATGGDYPDLSQYSDINVSVSLTDQRVYIKSGDTTIYTMICSSGMDNTTPTGTYYIYGRGESFYNKNEKMGAKWWVGFQGNYLFHSVPTDVNGDYIVSEAEKLGHPASHGCLRLSVSDAKWFYDNIAVGTKVVIA